MRHELALIRRGLGVLGVAVPLAAVAGGVGWGAAGAASVLVGGGIVGANQVVAGLSTGWARRLRPSVLAVSYGVFVLRMLAVIWALTALAGTAWVERPLLVAGFCVALASALGAECVSYARASYVPSWRTVPR